MLTDLLESSKEIGVGPMGMYAILSCLPLTFIFTVPTCSFRK